MALTKLVAQQPVLLRKAQVATRELVGIVAESFRYLQAAPVAVPTGLTLQLEGRNECSRLSSASADAMPAADAAE